MSHGVIHSHWLSGQIWQGTWCSASKDQDWLCSCKHSQTTPSLKPSMTKEDCKPKSTTRSATMCFISSHAYAKDEFSQTKFFTWWFLWSAFVHVTNNHTCSHWHHTFKHITSAEQKCHLQDLIPLDLFISRDDWIPGHYSPWFLRKQFLRDSQVCTLGIFKTQQSWWGFSAPNMLLSHQGVIEQVEKYGGG